MKILIFKLILLLIIFSGCSSGTKKPKNLISEKKMELIMQDIILIRVIEKNYNNLVEYKNWLGDEYIYEKYKVDSIQLLESEKYYAKSPKRYLKIHEDIYKNLEKLIDSIDLLSKEQIRKAKELVLKNRDSLELNKIKS